MSSQKLFLLGSPYLERNGVPLEFGARKNVALITYPAITGKRHTHEALIGLRRDSPTLGIAHQPKCEHLCTHFFPVSTAMLYCNTTVGQ